MIRLTELSGAIAGGPSVRWDQRSVDVLSVVQTARTLRAEFIADHTHRGLKAFASLSGLSGLVAALRCRRQQRRTLKALGELDDRMLSDIGVNRADIEATAAFCCETKTDAAPSLWQRLGAWVKRERARRHTVRELSAISDTMLADIGISRGDIPAVAAALAGEQPVRAMEGEPVEGTDEIAVPAQILAVVQFRRGTQQAANQNRANRPAA